jgi:nitrite reductase/ring-hydroxylating ferredoxin subunit
MMFVAPAVHEVHFFFIHRAFHSGPLYRCPKHGGIFDYRTGEAMRAPVCVNLNAYRTRVEDGRVWIEI